MKNTFSILLFFILILTQYGSSFAQEYADKTYYLVDSLDLTQLSEQDESILESSLKLYHSSKDDTSKINALSGICENMMNIVWVKYQNIQHQLIEEALQKEITDATKRKLLDMLSLAYNNIGYVHQNKGETKKALSYYNKSINIQEKLGNKTIMANSYANIGGVYASQGDVERAIEYAHKSLKAFEKVNNELSTAATLVNIGGLYHNQKDYDPAFEYYKKGLAIYKKMKDQYGIAYTLISVGLIHELRKDTTKALECYLESLEIRETIGDKLGISNATLNIGRIYNNRGKTDLAFEYFKKSLQIEEELGNKRGICPALENLARVLLKKGKIRGEDGALSYASRSLKIAKELAYPENIRDAAGVLGEVYEALGKNKEGLEMYKLYIQMRDSVTNQKHQKVAIQQQAKYEYEKQKVLDDAEHEKQLAIEQKAKEKQQIITYAAAGGLGLVGVFLIFVFNRLKVTRRQKSIIEKAHTELGEKNKEILDSINYAKRIQSAILPPDKVVKEYLQQSFILYQPKDIVAGDFYWLEVVKNKVLFAAADCTGHGVPGAMVSVVCNNGLNRSVREYGLTDPGQILDKTRDIVVQEFEKSEEEVKDGMDIALCTLEESTLHYAGAHNPLWIIRNGATEIEEIKADKQPIGKFDHAEPYKTHKVELNKGDSFYTFSDGFADQFGGEKGKKFKTANFKRLLLSLQKESMDKQKQLIAEAFEHWKGDLEQLDDVCIIGVRI